jgi:hypothetical protein
MKLRHLFMFVSGFAVVAGASAMSLRELRGLELLDKKQGEAYVNYYLVGAMEANAFQVRAGAKPLFCQNGRRLEPRMARSLFDTELKRSSELYEADMGAPLVMANALATAYPCE